MVSLGHAVPRFNCFPWPWIPIKWWWLLMVGFQRKKWRILWGTPDFFQETATKYHPQNDCNAIIWSLLERPWPFWARKPSQPIGDEPMPIPHLWSLREYTLTSVRDMLVSQVIGVAQSSFKSLDHDFVLNAMVTWVSLMGDLGPYPERWTTKLGF